MSKPCCTITLFTYEWPHTFNATRTIRRRTQFGALFAAKRALVPHEVETTRGCYHRDVPRRAYCVIRRGARKAEIVNAAVRIVKSVGELGVTP